ncbi:MAG TPA: hypothetical protein ENG42_01775 [Candidatus Aenigmarchaeota archaeon]|nr:hypothetical protein [Candidatus Aenigmarchaeota archaeon]
MKVLYLSDDYVFRNEIKRKGEKLGIEFYFENEGKSKGYDVIVVGSYFKGEVPPCPLILEESVMGLKGRKESNGVIKPLITNKGMEELLHAYETYTRERERRAIYTRYRSYTQSF